VSQATAQQKKSDAGVDEPARSAMSTADLAELMQAFNEVTAKLQTTHESLRDEVSRLQGELAQANRQLERAQRLAALGEMAAGIAHEVRNPLGSIRLHARMLEQDLVDRPSERVVTCKILSAVAGLEAVVTDVLAFSKEFKVRPVACDASELVEQAVGECLTMEQSRIWQGADRELPALLVNRGDLDETAVLECDPTLVHRALVNVMRNAIQAMTPEAHERKWTPERRELTVGVRVERIAGPDGAGQEMATLSVGDTGPGIPQGVMERIFNPFFTTRAAGTGLGLSIVHRIVDAHHGLVRVRNRDGAETGAIVEVLLPVRQTAENSGTHGTTRGSDAALHGPGAGGTELQPCTAKDFAGLTEQA
jgi:signal transduction histidine kinase